jgi:hypothetical protein
LTKSGKNSIITLSQRRAAWGADLCGLLCV